ncbi:MAG: hypothetical protein PHG79_09460 [Methanosarcina sp.]|nr:hypothetical protein [Methanosarcina sp.]
MLERPEQAKMSVFFLFPDVFSVPSDLPDRESEDSVPDGFIAVTTLMIDVIFNER